MFKKDNTSLNFIDLFAGAGGLSEGYVSFLQALFELASEVYDKISRFLRLPLYPLKPFLSIRESGYRHLFIHKIVYDIF